MKKFTLSVAAIMLTIISGFAQNLILWDSVAHFLPSDTTLIKSGPVDADKEMYKYLAVKNNSTSTLGICMKKVIIDTIPGSVNYFCWAKCYPANVYTPADTIQLSPQKTDFYHFVGHYRPIDKKGASTIRYVFYERANPNDSVSVKVTYLPTGLGIVDAVSIKNSISATPNPASEEVNFSYTLTPGSSGKIIILQVTGTVISETQVQGTHGNIVITAQDMKDGLYFYYLMVDGKVCSAKKLIIRHQ